MTLHIRAPWLRYFAERRHRERRKTMREVYEAWQQGLDFELAHSVPTHSEIAAISNVVPFRREG